jgi:hypothetical protein
MRRGHSKAPDVASLDRIGTFHLRGGEHPTSACETQKRVQYSVPNANGQRCVLLPPKHEAALQCLAGNPLAFLGTSVTRYQYLSFTHFLDQGKFPPRCTSAHAPGVGPPPLEYGLPSPMTAARQWHDHSILQQHNISPSVVKEREWATPATNHWHAFFEGTSSLLSQRGLERCDCKTGGGHVNSTSQGDVDGTNHGGSSGRSGHSSVDGHSHSARTAKPLARGWSLSMDGRPVRFGRSCGRHFERRFYTRNLSSTPTEDRRIRVSYVVSDCGLRCADWAAKCSACWRDSGISRDGERWIVLNQGGLQAGWFHPGFCCNRSRALCKRHASAPCLLHAVLYGLCQCLLLRACHLLCDAASAL